MAICQDMVLGKTQTIFHLFLSCEKESNNTYMADMKSCLLLKTLFSIFFRIWGALFLNKHDLNSK